MLYLLAASAEWLAAALVVGLVVGFWTTTREKDATFAGHGVVVTSAFVIAGGFFLANLQTLPGRSGLFLELGMLLAAAYLIGLPLGGGAKLLLAPAPAAPAKRKPPHVVLRGAATATAAPEPMRETAGPETATSLAPAEPPAEPVAKHVPEPPAPVTARDGAEPRREKKDSEKKLPGQRPEGLASPRGGRADDLTKIKGLGPKSVEKLHGLGVYHFDQIAGWSSENVAWIGASLAVPGRPERGRWVAQAKELAGARSEAPEQAPVE